MTAAWRRAWAWFLRPTTEPGCGLGPDYWARQDDAHFDRCVIYEGRTPEPSELPSHKAGHR